MHQVANEFFMRHFILIQCKCVYNEWRAGAMSLLLRGGGTHTHTHRCIKNEYILYFVSDVSAVIILRYYIYVNLCKIK